MKISLPLSLLLILVTAGQALADSFSIENFESGNLAGWWQFGKLKSDLVEYQKPADSGRYYLNLQGETDNFYIGGIGKYLGADLKFFTLLEVDVYGNGENSGNLKIEFYDDDKGSWQTKYDKNWVPLKDDLWSFEIPVSWQGLKHLEIPFFDFRLINPGRGNGSWDPNQLGQSGGLLQIQLIALTREKSGRANFSLDNLKFSAKSVKIEDYLVPKSNWWKFGKLELKVENEVMKFSGQTSNWYLGGGGTYLGLNAEKYAALEMDIYGTGKGSGNLKIEFYDDDKGSWQTKYDKNWVPVKDDLWSYAKQINWEGWKHLVIPFADLELTNPGCGNGSWDPNQNGTSGGLLQIQLVISASQKTGGADFGVANLKLVPTLNQEAL